MDGVILSLPSSTCKSTFTAAGHSASSLLSKLVRVGVAQSASMSIGVQKGLHIAVGFFFNILPPAMAKIVEKIDNLIVMSFGAFLLYYGALLVQSTMSSTLPATQWPAGMEYLMIPVGGFFIIYFSLINLLGLQRYQHFKLYEDPNPFDLDVITKEGAK